MTAKIISMEEARIRRRPVESDVSYDNAVAVAWTMLDEGEVGPHEFLEMCREAMAEG